MGIWDSLFGKKVEIKGHDKTGKPFSRKVSARTFERLVASGALSKLPLVEVHVLDPNGSYTARWEIGKDISDDVVQQARDPESGDLYAVTTYEAGKPKTIVCLKEQWLTIKAKMDAIDQEAATAGENSSRNLLESFPPGARARPASDEEKTIGSILMQLPRCKANVIVGSAKLDDAYSCSFFVGASALEKWLSAKISNGQFTGQTKVHAKAFAMWLQAADILQPGASGITQTFYNCIKDDVTELVNTPVANVHCKECKEIYSNVNVAETDVDDADIYTSWRVVWTCPQGHVVYNRFHELYISLTD